jgi:hypothetical protein
MPLPCAAKDFNCAIAEKSLVNDDGDNDGALVEALDELDDPEFELLLQAAITETAAAAAQAAANALVVLIFSP